MIIENLIYKPSFSSVTSWWKTILLVTSQSQWAHPTTVLKLINVFMVIYILNYYVCNLLILNKYNEVVK